MGLQQKLPGFDFAADIDLSIEILRRNAPPKGNPYYGLFSGGKDSVALREVARMAGVSVAWHYNVTTIDPPELVRFVRSFGDVEFVRPSYGNLLRRAAEVKGFPTRRQRWCCEEYKESRAPRGRVLLMGVRAQESPARAARWGHVTTHRRTLSKVVNPLLWWEAEDLWGFIRGNGVRYCTLYDEGFHRLGCIGCPMARKAGRLKEFARWPRFEAGWRRVFRRVWERRAGTLQRDGREWFGTARFDSWEEMYEWWLSDRSLPKVRTGSWRKD